MTYDRIYDEIDEDVKKVYPNFDSSGLLEVDTDFKKVGL